MLAFVTLFRLATMDGWSNLLYISWYGCDKIGYDDMDCKNSMNGNLGTPSMGSMTLGHGKPHGQPYFALVYFVIFVIIAALILLSMFIGAYARPSAPLGIRAHAGPPGCVGGSAWAGAPALLPNGH
jgi:hypothetical protein